MKKHYLINLFLNQSQSLIIDAENEQEAQQIAVNMSNLGEIEWGKGEAIMDLYAESSGEVSDEDIRLFYSNLNLKTNRSKKDT